MYKLWYDVHHTCTDIMYKYTDLMVLSKSNNFMYTHWYYVQVLWLCTSTGVIKLVESLSIKYDGSMKTE